MQPVPGFCFKFSLTQICCNFVGDFMIFETFWQIWGPLWKSIGVIFALFLEGKGSSQNPFWRIRTPTPKALNKKLLNS